MLFVSVLSSWPPAAHVLDSPEDLRHRLSPSQSNDGWLQGSQISNKSFLKRRLRIWMASRQKGYRELAECFFRRIYSSISLSARPTFSIASVAISFLMIDGCGRWCDISTKTFPHSCFSFIFRTATIAFR